ncbi:MAG TPA: hypothetical protein VKM72_23330 [Thermoanaerobaculia bacterium]|nr:hypothetical protein [Thermoanaerobaculia bacterium]
MDDTNIRFSHLIAELALHPARLAQYRNDPEKAMDDAGLSDEEKDVLRTGNFGSICDWLADTSRPITEIQPGPGSGPGGT